MNPCIAYKVVPLRVYKPHAGMILCQGYQIYKPQKRSWQKLIAFGEYGAFKPAYMENLDDTMY